MRAKGWPRRSASAGPPPERRRPPSLNPAIRAVCRGALVMMTCMKRALLLSLFAAGGWAQINDISGERMRAHVKFLASDLLEGRGVGTRGGELATEYIAAQFAVAGLKPAGDHGTYFQNFTLTGSDPRSDSQMSATTSAGASIPFKWL